MSEPIRKTDTEPEDQQQGPQRPVGFGGFVFVMTAKVVAWVVSSLFFLTPFLIVALIVLAVMWGAGWRMIVEAFGWSYDLFGF